MTSFEPQQPQTIAERISTFRALGYMKSLTDDFTTSQLVDSYLTGGSNNQDFVRIYQEIYNLIHAITTDSEFLEHLHHSRADELMDLLQKVRSDVAIGLEPAINDISVRSTTIFELVQYIGTIPSSNFDEHAQTLLAAAEIFRSYNDPINADHQKLHDQITDKLLNKIETIRVKLTLIEDLAFLLMHLIRDIEAAHDQAI